MSNLSRVRYALALLFCVTSFASLVAAVVLSVLERSGAKEAFTVAFAAVILADSSSRILKTVEDRRDKASNGEVEESNE
ncbi:MAG: hypothetical protein F4X59_17095 [Holophagales bacterium]|nr:hypothetical protein [Holophagales bacterium]MYC11823.1 hypothetical protein [Holophagales bacterium]